MNKIEELVKKAQVKFKKKLEGAKEIGGLTRERYIRFLSMQYHLTNGVQKHFMSIAANPLTAKKIKLRKWLINFAQEEEFHHEIALSDLKELGATPLPIPFDTQLWWNHFDSLIDKRPFIRLGGTCILENISEGSAEVLDSMIATSGYLNKKNLKFLIIHRHGPNLDHGAQVLEMLAESNLTEAELADVEEGAKKSTIMYMRVVHWIIHGEELE